MAEDGGKIFPVIFSDGEREVHMGNVKIQPSTDFKTFQESLSDRIGISQNQINVYLTDERRRIPVSKANFAAAIADQTTGFSFLVVLKRSRRGSASRRSPKPKLGGFRFGDGMAPVPENYRLLRRDDPGVINPYGYDQISALEYADFNERFRNLEIQRENYARMMRNFDLNAVRVNGNVFRASSTVAEKDLFCEECGTAPFHHCAFDAVVVGFRSTVGPVARPRKAVSAHRLAC